MKNVLKWVGITFIGSMVLLIIVGIIVDANKSPEQKAADAAEAVVREQKQAEEEVQQAKEEQEKTATESTETNKNKPAPKPVDAVSVKLTRDKIAAIENEFSAEQDKFGKLMVNMVKQKKPSKKAIEKLNKSFNVQIEKMSLILDKSESITLIKLENEDAKRYLTEAVDYHKKWALAHKAQLNSFLIADIDEAKRYGALSDSFADQEALSLVMAYQSVGLELPH